MKQYDINAYPKFIEPTINAVEVEVSVNKGKSFTRQLSRIDSAAFFRANTMATPSPHCFGLEEDHKDNRWILGYDCSGVLQTVYVKKRRFWEEQTAPEEVRGETAKHPSVRIAFNSSAHRDVFLDYLKSVDKGHLKNSELKRFLGTRVESYRVIDVGKEK